jgi:hypothetical protein
MAIGKTAACLTMVAAMWGAEVKFPARHDHLRKGCDGTVTVTDDGISFAGKKKHVWSWKYQDIQQLEMAPRRLRVLTYSDNRWKLGADREYEFRGEVPRELYQLWSAKLDQRFVAELADTSISGWSIPVKHLQRVRGSEGVLRFGPDRVVYETAAKQDSRTWRYQDLAGISSSGPFQLTITSFERARSHYGDRKGFNFQLKAALDEARYNQLWLDIETKNGRIQR